MQSNTHTHSLHTWYQTSAAPPAGSWPGEGQEPPGSGFTRRLLVHALTRSPLFPPSLLFYSSYSLLFPHSFKASVCFDTDVMGERNKTRNAICADEIKKCQRACKIIWPWKKEWNQNDKACDELRTETKKEILFPRFSRSNSWYYTYFQWCWHS